MKVIIIHETEAESLRKDINSVGVLIGAALIGATISDAVGVLLVLIALVFIVASTFRKNEAATSREEAKARIDAIFDELEKARAEG